MPSFCFMLLMEQCGHDRPLYEEFLVQQADRFPHVLFIMGNNEFHSKKKGDFAAGVGGLFGGKMQLACVSFLSWTRCGCIWNLAFFCGPARHMQLLLDREARTAFSLSLSTCIS